MQTFYIANDERRLYIFTYENNEWKNHYINGEPFVVYTLPELNDKASYIKNYLIDEYNAESANYIRFLILADANESVTDAIMFAFLGETPEDESIAKKTREHYVISITEPIRNAILNLSKRSELLIKEYGVNYGGYWYYLEDNKLKRDKNFSLTAYTLSITDVLNQIKEVSADE